MGKNEGEEKEIGVEEDKRGHYFHPLRRLICGYR